MFLFLFDYVLLYKILNHCFVYISLGVPSERESKIFQSLLLKTRISASYRDMERVAWKANNSDARAWIT